MQIPISSQGHHHILTCIKKIKLGKNECVWKILKMIFTGSPKLMRLYNIVSLKKQNPEHFGSLYFVV